MVANSHLFLSIKIKDKVEKLTINIVLVYKNDNYYEQFFFTQINNYYKLERVLFLVDNFNFNILKTSEVYYCRYSISVSLSLFFFFFL